MELPGRGRYPRSGCNLQPPLGDTPARQIIAETPQLLDREMGRSYGDASLGGTLLGTLRLDRLRAFDEQSGVPRCDANVGLAEIVDVFLPHGWLLAVTPETPEKRFVSGGSAIASDVHGNNHDLGGCFSEFVDSLTLGCGDGQVRHSSPSGHPELFVATCGGIGRFAWPALLDASLLLLASYNLHAFGKATKPYSDGALEPSTTASLVSLGLLLDQNQGMLLQNLLFRLGILYLPGMFRQHPVPPLFWELTFYALVVPNAMHPNWHGGLSFSGRFGGAVALALFLPSLVALKPFQSVLGGNKLILLLTLNALQVMFFFKFAHFGVSLYNRPAESWLSKYSALYRPLHNWVPAPYNVGSTGHFAPNYQFTSPLLFVSAYGARCSAESECLKRTAWGSPSELG